MMVCAVHLLLGWLVFPLLCTAVFSDRRILLQGRVIDTINMDNERRVLSTGQRAEYLVQLQPPVNSKKIKAVEKATGVTFVVGVRIPHHSMLVVATEGQVTALESHPDVYWVGDFDAHYKYPAMLQSWVETHLATAKTTDLVIVLHSIASTKVAEQLVKNWVKEIRSADVILTVRQPIIRTNRVRVTLSTSKLMIAVQWLSKQIGTLWIEPAIDTRSFANVATGIIENGVSQPSNILNVAGLDGGGINFEIVSLADTGLNYGSCFFNQTMTPTSAFEVKNKIVSLVTEPGASGTDTSGHGTAMAGLIAGNPQTAHLDYHGVAPNAKIAFTAVTPNADGSANAPADIIAYLDTAKNTYQSFIIVGAFGTATPVPWYSTNDEDVDNWLYTFPNVLAVFSSGNFGQTQGNTNVPGVQLASPAVAKNVLTVGASQNDINSIIGYATATGDMELLNATSADSSQFGKNIVAPFSSKGPSPDGRFKPDVVAPGMGIFTADLTSCGIMPVEGTSFAAALVGGAAVLVRQYFRNGFQNTGIAEQSSGIPSPSSALLKAVLINSGVGLDGYSPAANQFLGTNNQVPHPAYGFGRVQLNNALWLNDSPGFQVPAMYQDATYFLKQGETVQFCFDVTANSTAIKITLAWTDLAGSSVAGYALTNNLDLLLMDPTGRTFYSNGLTAFDSINNVEQVSVQSPTIGAWVALIYGHSIDSEASPQGQKYALALSGAVKEPVNPCTTHCPHACNGMGSCNQGVCTCNSGRFGVDCSLTACPNNCTAADGSINGICNAVTSQCECAAQFAGDDCRLPAGSTIFKRKKGLSNGAIAGIAIGTFFGGAIICGILGFVAAIQYLVWKRNKHKRILEEGQK